MSCFKNVLQINSLRLFCVNEQSDFEEFHTELRELFRAMSYRKDKEKFLSLAKDERLAHLSEETGMQ